MDDRLMQAQQRYQQLRAMRDAGQLHPQQFLTEVQKLQWQDSQGIWYLINPEGVVLMYNGQSWVPAPLGYPPPGVSGASQPYQPAQAAYQPQAAAVPQQAPYAAGQVPPAQPAPAKRSSVLAATPILAILPAILCGGGWFLYTLLGVFKYEGIRGVDFLTPLFVSGLPILFWVLKEPLDKLLAPLAPTVRSIPRALRLGVCIGIPIFLGVGCSLLSSSGYFALSISALVSVVTAAVLMRF